MADQSTLSDAGDSDLRRARQLVLEFGHNATAYQILNPGLKLWFNVEPSGVVGFVETKRRRVVAGEPIGPAGSILELADRFERRASRDGVAVCYFGAEAPLADAEPVDRLLLGAQPCWRPRSWQRILGSKASLRGQLARARNKGVLIEEWDVDRATGHPELNRCLEEWLATRGLPPMHFLVEPETLERLFDRRVLVARRQATVVAFLVASPIQNRNGWLVEQIVRGHAAPNGTAELLLDALFDRLDAEESRYVTLGLSPLSHRSGLQEPPDRWWIRLLLGWVRAHGRRFYDFDGLDFFKDKLKPDHWEPIYAVCRGRRLGLGDLYAIGSAFSGGTPWRFLAAGVGRAIRSEARTLIRIARRPGRRVLLC